MCPYFRRGSLPSLSQTTNALAGALSNPDVYQFGICLSNAPEDAPESDDIIGTIGMQSIITKLISYEIHPAHWRKGYMTQALEAFLHAYFNKFPDEKHVFAVVALENAASSRVLEKCGFTSDRGYGADHGVLNSFSIEFQDLRTLEADEEELLREAIRGLGLQGSRSEPRARRKVKGWRQFIYEKK
jgi:RimJ/RimL family protein N-acetyltransferase